MYRCVARTPPAAGIRPSVGPVAASGSQSLQWHAPSYASPWGQSPTAKCSSLASYNASQPYGLQPPHPKGSLELTCHQTQMLGVSFSWERSGRDVSSSETITGFPAASGLPYHLGMWQWAVMGWGSQAWVVLGLLLSSLFSLWATLWLCMWALIYQVYSKPECSMVWSLVKKGKTDRLFPECQNLYNWRRNLK